MARSAPATTAALSPPASGDRELPGDRRGESFRRPDPGPARMRTTRRIEEETLDATVEVGTAARHEVGGHRREIRWLRGRKMEDLPRPASDPPGEREGLIAAELDDVGIDRGQDIGEPVRGRIRGDGHDERPVRAGPGGPGETGQGGCLRQRELPRRAGHDVEPDRVRTGRDRRQHAVGVRDAADLDRWPARDVGRIVGRRTGGDERPSGRRGVRRTNQGLADEGAIDAERAPAGDRGRVADPRFGDDEPIVRHELAQATGSVQVHLERPQVPVVEPDEPGPGRERPFELACVMDLDEGFEADLERTIDESSQSFGRMEHRQQEHEVRAGRAKHRQLDRFDDEVLGEDRDGDGRPDGAQVVDRAAEPVRLAQHGDRRRTTDLVGPGASHDVVAGDGDPPG